MKGSGRLGLDKKDRAPISTIAWISPNLPGIDAPLPCSGFIPTSQTWMTDRLAQRHTLVEALITALGTTVELSMVVGDLAQAGSEGRSIATNVERGGSLKAECTALVTVCSEYSNGLVLLEQVLESHLQGKIAWPPLKQSLQAYRKGDEDAQQTEPAVHPAQEVYISYAWGDETPQGKQRQELVEMLCASLVKQGVEVRRDCTQINPGDPIRAYMQRLAKGDVILVVLSDRYLRSEACMTELYWIWANARQDPDRFLGRVIPLTLPDADLRHTADRFARAEYWLKESKDLDIKLSQNIRSVGGRIAVQAKLIRDIAAHTSDMLELLVDKFEPRDFKQQAQEEFKEVLDQVKALCLSASSPSLND